MKLYAKKGSYRLCEILPAADWAYDAMAIFLPQTTGVPIWYHVIGGMIPTLKVWPKPAYGIEIEICPTSTSSN